MLSRRTFIGALVAVPVVGRFVAPEPKPTRTLRFVAEMSYDRERGLWTSEAVMEIDERGVITSYQTTAPRRLSLPGGPC